MTFEEFCTKEVVRTGESAEIIFDYYEGRPIRLVNFNAELSDFEILEEGFDYYQRLKATCSG